MKKNAFTLIELLAVILILGIIALIAIPTITKIL
ncbi:MAG: prepilin-type N-terminal cleavage/methylation domain-containing protein, partial [Bacilli bacterium]